MPKRPREDSTQAEVEATVHRNLPNFPPVLAPFGLTMNPQALHQQLLEDLRRGIAIGEFQRAIALYLQRVYTRFASSAAAEHVAIV